MSVSLSRVKAERKAAKERPRRYGEACLTVSADGLGDRKAPGWTTCPRRRYAPACGSGARKWAARGAEGHQREGRRGRMPRRCTSVTAWNGHRQWLRRPAVEESEDGDQGDPGPAPGPERQHGGLNAALVIEGAKGSSPKLNRCDAGVKSTGC